MDGSKVAVERLLIDPYFLDVDEAGLEYVFGVTILQAAFSWRLASAIRFMIGRAVSKFGAGKRKVPMISNMM